MSISSDAKSFKKRSGNRRVKSLAIFFVIFAINWKDIFQTMQIPTRIIPVRVAAKQTRPGKATTRQGIFLDLQRQGKCQLVQMQNQENLKKGVVKEK